MSFQDDETLKMYVEESIEHLADIENDLLAIEEAGADIDKELVNKVFRAAHSIKGGAGFMGLNNIKDLAHKMENVLGMIRSREMTPNPEITNILLQASDLLRNLINNVAGSNEIDISGIVESLIALTIASLPDEERESVTKIVKVSFPEGTGAFTVAEYDISTARKEGKYLYIVEFDLIHDIQRKDKTPLGVLNEMEESGIILDSKIDIDAVGKLDEEAILARIPFFVLFASILEPSDINNLFKVDEKQIYELAEDFSFMSIEQISHLKSDTLGAEENAVQSEISTKEALPEIEESKVPEKAVKAVGTRKEQVPPAVVAETSLRVHVSLLDSLMNLAGELVLGRNQLIQAIGAKDLHTIEAAGQRMDLITTELQETIMVTRMQPIGNVFNKFPRVVRDLAINLDKKVDLLLEGNDVELDKTIIEAISDPLTHLVRNSVDHGIERPDEREKAGKAPKGEVVLRAYHEAGQVNIDITDDGKGLDGEKLAQSAFGKGLITEEQVKLMSDKEKISLIFLPGFSTAEKVSDVSGRGVGMDVVKTNLDKLGGVVDIDSRIGRGTTIKIKLPLTLAIIPSQIISTEGERYAIPQVNLEELLRIPADKVKERMERVGDAEVVRLRGQLLPLIRLAEVFGIHRTYLDPDDGEGKKDRRIDIVDRRSGTSSAFKPDKREGEEAETRETEYAVRSRDDRRFHADSAVNIVVVSTGALKYGLIVDVLHDSEEIVVKPLGRHMKHCNGYAGAAIMGDGRVALILDVAGLSGMAGLNSVEGTGRASEVVKKSIGAKEDSQSLLVFRNAEDEQFSVPLGLVSRIEKIKRDEIEEVGGKKVMQYRGESLPLVAINDVSEVKSLADKEELIVIVFRISGREVGLFATSPVDAIETDVQFDDSTLAQQGIMGSAIINEHTTLMIDIFGIVQAINPDWFNERETIESSDGKLKIILYAEDSTFFRNQVKNFMEDEGYHVIEAEDGAIAWDLLEEHADEIDMVVTDIEMPNLNGFELVEKMKADERFSGLPIIAMTTLAGDQDIARGKEVGIDDYQIKLDREKLMDSIHKFFEGK